jgi:hypothetical protein
MHPGTLRWLRATRLWSLTRTTTPESTVFKLAFVTLLILGITVTTFVADAYNLRVIAAAFLIPAVVTIHFWGLKKAIPVLIAVPVLNELISFSRSWADGR